MVSLCYKSLVGYITEDNLVGFRNFLESRRTQVDDRDDNGSTALIYASTRGSLSFVRELLNYGADVNAEDSDNWTALLCASKEGHTEVVQELVEHGASVLHMDMGGWTALMWAAYKGHTEIAALLVEKGADVNAHENYHVTVLHWACGRGHADIARMLIRHGAKVNVGDKYGTTALIWASRKGNADIVDMVLKCGANVDTAGMYSWTALLVATSGNHVDVVKLLLEYKPNVNAHDKDGYTALAISCKEGFYEIAAALLSHGAYINIQDRSGDTNLILAVKGGHRNVVEALLKKYADVDIPGKDRKTAIYTAVEKGNVQIVKLLLTANPDLEIATRDGDTPLLRSVRSRNAEIVQLLLDKKAKVSATDKKGDTTLHIAMRARSKAIVEVLLRNPRHSQLLYRPNKAGETPYNIDVTHQKTILGQIFGARRLNTNEDNENMLGYDLYSSALADILSEPSLSMPINVGLYAKWGSGKSFLLNKLREEMKNFARRWIDPTLQLSPLLTVILFHIALISGLVVGLASMSWLAGVIVGPIVFLLCFTFLIIVWCIGKRYDWNWPYQASVSLAKQINSFRLIIQVMFCHPPGSQWFSDGFHAQPIRFNFTDLTRVSSTTGGENSVVQMLGSLYDSIENDFGSIVTRLCRAFRPKALKPTSPLKWRKACCLPYIIVFEVGLLLLLFEVSLVTIYIVNYDLFKSGNTAIDDMTVQIVITTIGILLAVAFVANIYTISHTLKAIVFSQRRHLQRNIARLDTVKSEGFLQAVKAEVVFMTEMVKSLDSLTMQQTRLVVIVDGLDSCEQDKVLLVLDAVHMLFSDASSPYIVILAIDPHIIAKAVEVNSRRLISESNIGGHEYLRNMVHLPFFLANSALRKVKIAQNTSHRKHNVTNTDYLDENYPLTSQSSRRLSVESSFMSSTEKLKLSRKGSRKLKVSESIASSIGSNLNKIGGAQDLIKMLLTDDYFSDVNPRSMRRLLNVVYVTGRLLKAFQVDFNWYHLASWVNITEQWPYRTTWLIYFYEMFEDQFEDSTSLKSIYDKVRPRIPVSKEIEPLLEMDRDERKFDVFLTFHRSSLLLSDLKIFLPFTINLDPFIKKVIKEEQQPEGLVMNGGLSFHPQPNINRWTPPTPWITPNPRQSNVSPQLTNRRHNRAYNQGTPPSIQTMPPMYWPNQSWVMPPTMSAQSAPPLFASTNLPSEFYEIKLSQRNVDSVCDLVHKIEGIEPNIASKYSTMIKQNNISGRVLLCCDLEDLKNVMNMSFGDWEIFKMIILTLRDYELTNIEETCGKNVRFNINKSKQSDKKSDGGDKEGRRNSATIAKHSLVENQVSLEDQMICGALQTLNEEACEDVLEETGDIEIVCPTEDNLDTSVVILQSSPLNQSYCQAVSLSLDDGSPASSICGTPILQRRASRHNSATNIHRTGSVRSICDVLKTPVSKSRPSSLLLTEDQFKPERNNTPPSSPKNVVFFTSNETTLTRPKSSSSLFTTFSTSFKKKKKEITSPAVVITPASSTEKLNHIKTKLLRKAPGDSNLEGEGDDESTPLVLETRTPNHEIRIFTNDSPDSPVKSEGGVQSYSSRDVNSSFESLCGKLEGSCDSIRSTRSHQFESGPYDNSIDLQVSSRRVSSPPLVRQHEINQDSTYVDWESPETTL